MKITRKILTVAAPVAALALAQAANAETPNHAAELHGYGSVGYLNLAGSVPAKSQSHAQEQHGYGSIGQDFRSALAYQDLVQQIQAQATKELLAQPSPAKHGTAEWMYGYGAIGYVSLAAEADVSIEHASLEHGYGATGYNPDSFDL